MSINFKLNPRWTQSITIDLNYSIDVFQHATSGDLPELVEECWCLRSWISSSHVYAHFQISECDKVLTGSHNWWWKGAGPHGLCPPSPQPIFCLWENFSQRISLIREVRTHRSKGK